MTQHLETLYIANVTSKDAGAAYRFHERIATVQDSHLWARTQAQIRELIEDGCLFGAWLGEERQLVGLCYAIFVEKDQIWEVGGLCVDSSVEGRGIGTILVRFTLAHTIVYQQPWIYGQEIVAHVHEANQDPRGILEKAGFQFSTLIEVPESANPPKWMKRNAQGKILGHEFKFSPNKTKNLSAWFDQDLDKPVIVEFGLGPTNLEDFRTTLREISQDSRLQDSQP